MRVYTGDPADWDLGDVPTSVAIGVFDGVHRGHAAVFARLMEETENRSVVAMTFATHPVEVVTGRPGPPALTTLERRIELLSALDIDAVAVIEFDETVRNLSPRVFVETFIVEGVHAELVSVGEDFRFGYEAGGTVGTLRVCGGVFGFDVVSTPILTLHGMEVRSSSIRAAIASGSVALAARMLGRPFEVAGTVVPGDARGRSIGFPTANIAVPSALVRPASGVYAVTSDIKGARYLGVCNVGTRPTFGGGDETIEIHFLDFDTDLYDTELRVEFVDRLRNEQRFTSAESLIVQIRADIARARIILSDS